MKHRERDKQDYENEKKNKIGIRKGWRFPSCDD